MNKFNKIVKVKDKHCLVNLIYPTAIQYLNGAIILDKYFQENVMTEGTLDTYDASYLLRILSLELFLKTIVVLTKGESIFGHSYKEIYEYLDADTRNLILANLNSRSDVKYSNSQVKGYLAQYGKNFILIRYSYEDFVNNDIDEYSDIVRRFMQSEPHDFTHAKIIYYSKELDLLVESIKNLCDNLINDKLKKEAADTSHN